MEQCKLRPAKSGSLCSSHAKLRSLFSLTRKIMEQCRLCPVKPQRQSCRGKHCKINYLRTIFSFLFSNHFVNQSYFRDLYNNWDQFLREKNIFCLGIFKQTFIFQRFPQNRDSTDGPLGQKGFSNKLSRLKL